MRTRYGFLGQAVPSNARNEACHVAYVTNALRHTSGYGRGLFNPFAESCAKASLNENRLCPKKLSTTCMPRSRIPAIYGAARGFRVRYLTRSTVGGSNTRLSTIAPLYT